MAAEQPSALVLAAIRMAVSVLAARRERTEAERARRRATMRVVDSERERNGEAA